ncbi:MAG: metallophosphoesterase family protein [Mycobacteriaceae bacterium]|uniref:metallophosphoesterase family protein n=1 Tax=Corynebacterium sp. TaxID=1720 RepID=UPI003F97FA32
MTDIPASTATETLPQRPRSGTFRFLHTSDWQLGMDRWFLGEEAGPRYREARLSVIERLLGIADDRGCSAVVVAGDVFDDNLVDPVTWHRAVDILRDAPVPVFLLPGNHDPYDAASVYRSKEFTSLSPTVQVLSDTEPRPVEGTTAQIIGAPLLSKYMSNDPVAAAIAETRAQDAGADRATVRILVGHGATQSRGSGEDPSVIDVEAAASACTEGVIDMVALGDTHSVVNLHPSGTVWYSGSPEVTDFREQDGGGEGRSGHALVVDVTPSEAGAAGGSDVRVEEVATGSWHFLALSAEINGRDDVDDWVARLGALADKRTTVVKYALTGSVDLSTSAWLDREMDRLGPSFAALYPRQRLMDLHVVPGDGELADADWTGVVGTAARGLADGAADGDEDARGALRLLYRLSGQGE